MNLPHGPSRILDGGARLRVAATTAGLLALALALAAPRGPVLAQQPLVGVVTDRETSAPLAGVYVGLVAGEGEDERTVTAALTDESGRFVVAAEVGGTYRLRAERVGLATAVTDPFTFEAGAPPQRVALAERAVELDGLSVGARSRSCRLEAEEAGVVQRWWDEVRKALEATAFVEATELAGLRFERYEREWTSRLESIRSERTLPADSAPSRPFVALDAATLSDDGFVRGEPGERRFLAPDAAVLFSGPFLETHCLRVAGDGEREAEGAAGWRPVRPGELRLALEPTRRRPPDIRGELVVDTLSGELRTFDFEYANLPKDLPSRNEAGGRLTFSYLPSGAWIVSEWSIRMPRLGHSMIGSMESVPVPLVAGYLEVGGRAIEAEGRVVDAVAGRATLHGTVYDSLTGGPLARARVSVAGSRLSARADEGGRFTLEGVPAGRIGVTFHHEALAALGLPSPVVSLEVGEAALDTLRLSTPGFAAVVGLLCPEAPEGSASVLTGRVLDAAGERALGGVEVRASWVAEEAGGGAGRRYVERERDRGFRVFERAQEGGGGSRYVEGRVGSDGRYALCGVEGAAEVTLAVRVDSGGWREAGSVTVAEGRVVARDLKPGAEVRAVVRGTVRAADGGEPVSGAEVWVLAASGDTVAMARLDSTGGFRMEVPAGVECRVVAVGERHLREASDAFTLEAGESLDVDFELARSPVDSAAELEGLLVEVGSVERAAELFLRPLGLSPEGLGERWISREELDKTPIHYDIASIILSRSIVGVSVNKFNLSGGVCVEFRRGRSAAPGSGLSGRCALPLFNGAPVSGKALEAMQAQEFEAIVVLTPGEATALYGIRGRAGAVLVWSRAGGPR